MYSIDINAERCLYQDGWGVYIITQNEGHYYKGKSFSIQVNGTDVALVQEGESFSFKLADLFAQKAKGSTGYDDKALTSLHFEVKKSDSGIELGYYWSALDHNIHYMFPDGIVFRARE